MFKAMGSIKNDRSISGKLFPKDSGNFDGELILEKIAAPSRKIYWQKPLKIRRKPTFG